MKILRLILPLLAFSTALAPLPSLAQTNDNAQVMERVDRLEHDIMLLQRQVSRGGAPAAGATDADIPPGGAAQLEVRLSTIENELRNLRGKVEENENQGRKISENLDKLQKDTDFRFNQLASAAPAAGPAPVQPPPATPEGKLQAPPTPQGPTTAGDGMLHPPQPNQEKSNFSTPRDHYNYAFRLLNQTQYEQAANSFDAFTKKYPKDPLVGNAYYWEGETYYIRRDFVNAADNFRQGFEALPDGPKAADNLLKLAMSLDALSRDKEACVVLQQIMTKFKKSSTSVIQKADQEQKRIGCHPGK